MTAKISKRQALEETRDLWGWLNEHPMKDKEDWPRWKDNGGDVAHDEDHCSLCLYAAQEVGRPATVARRCPACPLISLWPNSCFSPGAAWWRWIDCETEEERSEIAAVIHLAAIAELKKMAEGRTE